MSSGNRIQKMLLWSLMKALIPSLLYKQKGKWDKALLHRDTNEWSIVILEVMRYHSLAKCNTVCHWKTRRFCSIIWGTSLNRMVFKSQRPLTPKIKLFCLSDHITNIIIFSFNLMNNSIFFKGHFFFIIKEWHMGTTRTRRIIRMERGF